MSNLNSATPNLPEQNRKPIPSIKIAEPQYQIAADTIADPESFQLSLDNLASRELVQIIRNDLVKGQNVTYKPIKNLSRLAFDYRPDTLVFLQNSSKTLFDSYAINLNNYLPSEGTGPGNSTVYVDPETGSLVIDFINLTNDYLVEVEVLSSGQVFDDTIYSEGS